ncbi:hypothetical protein RND71_040903 [Anisodus tanguticus]|uniref:CCHC-type domain-containing protein n=1 Tax=Anisodus tanguticus TaxID=243964 RepID=A0AAE1QTY1_9SOLA|nr:hypothetical protein RND71_040903 [Anisodus tanguticus]
MKLRSKLKNQKAEGSHELGDFCEQFGCRPAQKPPGEIHRKRAKKFHKKRRNNQEGSSKPEFRTFRKGKFKRSRNSQRQKGTSNIVCFKCGKIGHKANECRVKEKINNLSIDYDLKDQLKGMLLETSDSEDSDSNLAAIENEQLFGSTSSNSSSSEDEEVVCRCSNLNICILTQEEVLILDLTDKINDPIEKMSQLETYLAMAKGKKNHGIAKKAPQTYSLKTMFDRIAESSKKEPKLSDLHTEIKNAKSELKDLKRRVRILELQIGENLANSDEESEKDFEQMFGEYAKKQAEDPTLTIYEPPIREQNRPDLSHHLDPTPARSENGILSGRRCSDSGAAAQRGTKRKRGEREELTWPPDLCCRLSELSRLVCLVSDSPRESGG